MKNYTIDPVNLKHVERRGEIDEFLQKSNLVLDVDVDFTLVAHRGNQIIGTCSKSGKVIKCLAVAKEHRGEGLSIELVKGVIDRLFEEGYTHYFVFTQPDRIALFLEHHFKMIYKGDAVALLEGGVTTIKQRLDQLKKQVEWIDGTGRIALVMNCNPFTLGHLHLIESAAAEGKEVIVFVVEEDRSVFLFSDRLKMVRRGTAHLENVKVLQGTEYIISSATFPAYFLRRADERTTAFMEMDASIFCTYFSQQFGIGSRYVGEEPYCDLTRSYNAILAGVLENAGLDLVVVPRLLVDGQAVSASRVRHLIREKQDDAIKSLVPESTWHYILKTQEGREAAERIRKSDTPH